MSELVLNRSQIREVDRRAIQEYGIPSVVLMENAGRGVADTLSRLGASGPVVICCGKGNNAGDGLVLARHLELRQCPVKVLLWSEPSSLQGDPATNYAILRHTDIPVRVMSDAPWSSDEARSELADAEWIVDALLGTGSTGAPRPPLDSVVQQLNAADAKRLAIDVPSGVHCDTGEVAEVAFQAHHTCTFVAAKPGLLADWARDHVGQVHVLDIGVPRKLIDEVLAGHTA